MVEILNGKLNNAVFQDATRSPQFSATLRQWFCVWDAQLSCVSRPGAKPGSQKVRANA